MSPKHSTSNDLSGAEGAAGGLATATVGGATAVASADASAAATAVGPADASAATVTNRAATVRPSSLPSTTSEPSLGALVHSATSSFSTLLHGEIELAKLEVKASVKNAGTGAGLFAAAAVLAVFALIFGLIALAEGLVAAHLWRWVAYLIVFGLLIVLAGIAAWLGLRKVKRVKAPTQTIETTKDTVTALKKATSNQ